MCQTADQLNTSKNTTYFYKYKISEKIHWQCEHGNLSQWHTLTTFSGNTGNLEKSENSKVAMEKSEKNAKVRENSGNLCS